MTVPVETGALRSTIEAFANDDGSATYQEGGPEAPYAPLVEFGAASSSGGHRPAQPHYTPGQDVGREAVRREAEKLKGRFYG